MYEASWSQFVYQVTFDSHKCPLAPIFVKLGLVEHTVCEFWSLPCSLLFLKSLALTNEFKECTLFTEMSLVAEKDNGHLLMLLQLLQSCPNAKKKKQTPFFPHTCFLPFLKSFKGAAWTDTVLYFLLAAFQGPTPALFPCVWLELCFSLRLLSYSEVTNLSSTLPWQSVYSRRVVSLLRPVC